MIINDFLKIVTPYTMTSKERIISLFESLEYIRKNNISGDIVECGVWKGGNMLGAIEYLKYHNMNKKVWLYDTFSGMTKPNSVDIDLNGKHGNIWEGKCVSTLDEVTNLIVKTEYTNLKFVVGDIVKMLDFDENIPSEISLLRLDTDWYDSTKKEMNILYPKLINNGVLIIDDYGHWMGARKAVDEYFKEKNLNPSITKIDYTGIKIIKYDK